MPWSKGSKCKNFKITLFNFKSLSCEEALSKNIRIWRFWRLICLSTSLIQLEKILEFIQVFLLWCHVTGSLWTLMFLKYHKLVLPTPNFSLKDFWDGFGKLYDSLIKLILSWSVSSSWRRLDGGFDILASI